MSPDSDSVQRDGGTADELATDSDSDGLCDDSEAFFGTDPDSLDTDMDHLPDAIEVALGLDPLSNQSPDPSTLVILQSTTRDPTAFEVRFTVNGQGGDYVGVFNDLEPLFSGTAGAAAHLAASRALAAEPPDNVHSLDPEAETFQGVNGSTRLRFDLEFIYDTAQGPLDCALPLPFQYGVVEQGVGAYQSKLYLLVITPEAELTTAAEFCPIAGCI